jgi:predicted nucleic acid-binding protein
MAPVFFDSNVILYLASEDTAKASHAEELLVGGGVISVQVLNEFVSVSTRKYRRPWPAIEETLSIVRTLCRVEPLTLAVHEAAVALARDHNFSFYDALIVASARIAGCDTLFTEDMEHGRVIDDVLTILNPFRR